MIIRYMGLGAIIKYDPKDLLGALRIDSQYPYRAPSGWINNSISHTDLAYWLTSMRSKHKRAIRKSLSAATRSAIENLPLGAFKGCRLGPRIRLPLVPIRRNHC